jgi:DNA-nicking Smr family endonuclease
MDKNKGQQPKKKPFDFSQLMQSAGVVPIKKNNQQAYLKTQISIKKTTMTSPKSAIDAYTSSPVASTNNDPFSDQCEIKPLLAADVLSYCSHSIQKTAFRKFRKGHFPIADELDLHGLSRIEARELLLDFLQHTLIPSRHCVRIIHGKGHRSTGNQAILKTQVNHWLKQHKRVLAFYSCKPADGGTGAVYVLLRLL